MSDTSGIEATVAPWTQACLERDWDALLGLCTEDVVFSPPGEPQVSGGDVRLWLDSFPVMKTFDFGFESIEVGGDLATGTGKGAMTLELDGQDVSLEIKFVDVFRRGDDGAWRYAHVIWNLNEAAG